MKKIKILLSTLAVIAAIATTFATQMNSAALVDGYEFIPSEELCKQYSSVDCVAHNGTPCVINGITMRESPDSQAQCGQTLGKRN